MILYKKFYHLITEKHINRFWRLVSVDQDNVCWFWMNKPNKYGYGILKLGYLPIYAHRFSFVLQHQRDILNSLEICHTCDTPSCVNPNHLFEGTIQQNMFDKSIKGRTVKGILNGRAKLTNIDVKNIRGSNLSSQELSKLYNITTGHVCKIRGSRVWSHM